MGIQHQLTYELRKRVGLLPGVIDELKDMADKDANGMGIHQSQIDTVKAMLEQMRAEQGPLVQKLDPGLPLEEFAGKRTEVERFLTTSHSIMATFRYIFAQRKDSADDKMMLDIADLVVAHCYKPFMQLANGWRGLPADHYREPPLTYLNAMMVPAAISRRHDLKQIGLKLHTDTENRLPISVISLPFHDTVAVWTFCSLYHEVGHLLDNDLHLRAGLTEAMSDALKEAGKDDPDAARRRVSWESWAGEMVADAFGVLLGGAAYGHSLVRMLFRSVADVGALGSDDKHPNEHVRAHLLVALLRATGVQPLADAAQKIAETWRDAYGDITDLRPFVEECALVADVLLKTKLDVLRDKQNPGSQPHALVEFGYRLATDHKKIERLATWFREQVDQPDADNFTYRAIPAAAQLAVEGVSADFENKYASIQKEALAFIEKVYRDKFLNPNPNSAVRQAFLKKMIGELKFASDVTAGP